MSLVLLKSMTLFTNHILVIDYRNHKYSQGHKATTSTLYFFLKPLTIKHQESQRTSWAAPSVKQKSLCRVRIHVQANTVRHCCAESPVVPLWDALYPLPFISRYKIIYNSGSGSSGGVGRSQPTYNQRQSIFVICRYVICLRNVRENTVSS